MDEDLESIKKLSLEKNVAINVQEFRKPDHIVRMGFFREGDASQDLVQFYFAHWYMSMITMERLTKSVIDLSGELSKYYTEYRKEESTISERKKNYNYYVRTWQDFFGYLISTYNTIYDYYDLFVRLNKQLDPQNKDTPYYAAKSDEGPGELQAGVKELLLHGNRGRLTGFSLLRTMIEISVIRELFNTDKSIKYKGKEIIFKRQ